MAWGEKIVWGALGGALTLLTRKMTNAALHDADGMPALARVTQRNSSVAMILTLAALSGVVLALGDVLKENRQQQAAA